MRNSRIAFVLAGLAGSSSLAAQLTLHPSQINAPSAIVMDADTGRVLWRKNAFQRRANASTTKMLTAICARDFTRLPRGHRLRKSIRSVLRVSRAADNTPGSTGGLRAGDRLIMRDVLHALMLQSGNDAAVVLAENCLGRQFVFVDYMNRRARGLGLRDTRFRNPHGLDASGHYSTAYDLARLGREVLKDAELRNIILKPSYTTTSVNGRRYTWNMTNQFVANASYPGIRGIKTGTTDNAGQCLVAAARRGNRTVITVVLGNPRGSNFRYADSRRLLDYGFDAIFHKMPNPIVRADFNNDGYPDVAIGMPQANVGTRTEAGKVAILMGTPFGLNVRFPRFIHQDSPGVAGGAESFDHFGAALAVGRFNGDPYPDLAIGVPDEAIGRKGKAGAIHIVYSLRTGPDTRFRPQIFYGDQTALPFPSVSGDEFGAALAAGDFDRDGIDDLAIGMPGRDRSGFFGRDSGAVYTMHGSALRLSPGAKSRLFGGRTAFAAGHRFGSVLHAADFNRDGRADLAIGVPAAFARGRVDLIDGSANGLDVSTLSSMPVSGVSLGDAFGTSLASGDFNSDGRVDLAVGAPGTTVGGDVAAGRVLVHLAGTSGIRRPFTTLRFDGDTAGLAGRATPRDRFGQTLAAGDFNNDERVDLAIGVPGAERNAVLNAGAVITLHASSTSLTATSSRRLTQDSFGVPSVAAHGESFGDALAAGRFFRFAVPGLGVGVSGEVRPGYTHFFAGSASGIDTRRNALFTGRAEGGVIQRRGR